MAHMTKRTLASLWAKSFERSLAVWAREGMRQGRKQMDQAVKASTRAVAAKRTPPPGPGDWLPGVAVGLTGMLRFRLYRPPEVGYAERLPLVVMLHGCGQDAKGFALSTRMNRLAARERFLVLYPEQDRVANPHGCWNWFDTRNGRAYSEAALILKAIDQACLFYPADGTRIALVGLSAGASMAALLATRYPQRFKAVVMHSGVPPGAADSSASAMRAMRGRLPLPPLTAAHELPPLMLIHGERDTVVSSRNAQLAASLWADAAGAQSAEPRRVQRGQRHGMTVTDYTSQGRPVATLVEVDALGHAWSGGTARKPYSDSRGPDATRMAWAFALRQFKRDVPAAMPAAAMRAWPWKVA
jgi:poly(hydroxyalkanoate) depolymerase family esterase